MRKKNYQMNTCRRKYYIKTEKNESWSIQGSNEYTQKKILHENRNQYAPITNYILREL